MMFRNLVRNCTPWASPTNNKSSDSTNNINNKEVGKNTKFARELESARSTPSSQNNSNSISQTNFSNHFSGSTVNGLKRQNSAARFLNLWEDQGEKIQQQYPNSHGYKTLKDSSDRVYYIDQNNTVIYRGKFTPNGCKGATKKHRYGLRSGPNKESYIGLVPRKNANRASAVTENNDVPDISTLNLHTIVENRIVADNLLIAPNAGRRIDASPISVRAFAPALIDLTTLHQNHIYLRDIKLDNMAFDKNKGTSGQVNFIDVDKRIQIKPGTQYLGESWGTAPYTTAGLIRGIRASNKKENKQAEYFRTADEYAFLRCLIEATTRDNDLLRAIKHASIDSIGGKYPGIRNSTNHQHFEPWINKHVPPLYIPMIKELLTNPADFAKNNPDHPSLATMLTQTT